MLRYASTLYYADTVIWGEEIKVFGKLKNRMGDIEKQIIDTRDSGKRIKMYKDRHWNL